jgi:hypothetical protein
VLLGVEIVERAARLDDALLGLVQASGLNVEEVDEAAHYKIPMWSVPEGARVKQEEEHDQEAQAARDWNDWLRRLVAHDFSSFAG